MRGIMNLHRNSIELDSKKEQKMAKKSFDHLERALSHYSKGPISLKINDEFVELPVSVVNPLVDLLDALSKGKQFMEAEQVALTTQQAADLLNVSRPFLVKLIDTEKLPSYRVGRHRRVYKSDLLAYKEQSLKERKKILQKLVDEAQDLDLGY